MILLKMFFSISFKFLENMTMLTTQNSVYSYQVKENYRSGKIGENENLKTIVKTRF